MTKRARNEYSDIERELYKQFYRFLYCRPRALPNLNTYTKCFNEVIGLDSEQVELLYDTIRNVLIAAYRVERGSIVYCPIQPAPIICKVWMFFRRHLGKDLARFIVSLAFNPSKQQLVEAGLSVLKQCDPVRRSYPTKFTWGSVLIKSLHLN